MNFEQWWNSLPTPESDPTPERDRMIALSSWDMAVEQIPSRASDEMIAAMREQLKDGAFADAADAVLRVMRQQSFNALGQAGRESD